MRIFYGIITIITIFCTNSYSQHGIDSLLYKLEDSKGIEKVEILNELSEEFAYQNYNQSLSYALNSLELSDSLSYAKGKAYAFYNMGLVYYLKGDFNHTIEFSLSSLDLTDQLNDNILKRKIFDILARTYEEMNVLNKSLEYYQRGVEINHQLGNDSGKGLAMLGAGRVFEKMGRLESGIEILKEALKVFIKSDNVNGVAKTCILLGHNFFEIDETDSATYYFNKAYFEIEQLGDPGLLLDFFLSKSTLYGESYLDSTIFYLKKSLDVAVMLGRVYLRVDLLNELSETYSKAGDYTSAQTYHQQYASLNDSLVNLDVLVSKNEGKMSSDEFSSISNNETYSGSESTRTLKILLIGGGFVFLAILFVWFLRKYRYQQGSNHLINKIQSELDILSSDIKKKEELIYQLKEGKQYFIDQNNSLRQLISQKDNIEVPNNVQQILAGLAKKIDAEWVSVWLFKEQGRRLICYDEYDKEKDLHLSGEYLLLTDYPTYFNSILNSKWLETNNCREDTRTMELVEPRFKRRNIFLKMDFQLIDHEKLFGILMVERSMRNSDWEENEKETISLASESIIQSLLEVEKKTNNTKTKNPVNYSLLMRGMDNDLESIYGIRDIEGKIIEISGSVEHIMGYSPDEMIGKNYLEFVTSDFSGMVVDYHEKIYNGNFPERGFKYQLVDSNGESLILSERIVSILKDTKPALVCFELKRILDWRDDFRIQKEQDRRVRKILGSIQSPIILIDNRQTIIMTNHAVEQLLGYFASELNGRQIDFILFLEDESFDEIKKALASSFIEKDQEPVYFEKVSIKSKNGSKIEIPLTSYLMENENETNIIFEFSSLTFK